jgi:hypothetical protein
MVRRPATGVPGAEVVPPEVERESTGVEGAELVGVPVDLRDRRGFFTPNLSVMSSNKPGGGKNKILILFYIKLYNYKI